MGCHPQFGLLLLLGIQVSGSSPCHGWHVLQLAPLEWPTSHPVRLVCTEICPYPSTSNSAQRKLAVWYRYYEERGFAVILVSRILNLLALAFTIAFSAFLLLFVKWRALHSECILRDTCDISEASGLSKPFMQTHCACAFTPWPCCFQRLICR